MVNQTYKNLQVLIVDDGSTDGSSQICDEYALRDPRVTVIHQTHQNVSSARNVALDLATGQYIAFLDPDDAYLPSFIQTMLDTILREKSDIVICKYKIYRTTERMKQGKRGAVFPSISSGLYNRAQALDSLVFGKIGVEIWNKLYKREIWDDIRFPADLYAGSDHVVSYKALFNCSSAYVIDRALYMYRKHPESLTAMYSIRILKSRYRAISYVSNFMREHSPEVFSAQQIRRYDMTTFNAMMNYYAKCSKKDDSEYLKKQIIEMADKIGIENCSYRTRNSFYIMHLCPELLKCIYPVYSQIRLHLRNILGK